MKNSFFSLLLIVDANEEMVTMRRDFVLQLSAITAVFDPIPENRALLNEGPEGMLAAHENEFRIGALDAFITAYALQLRFKQLAYFLAQFCAGFTVTAAKKSADFRLFGSLEMCLQEGKEVQERFSVPKCRARIKGATSNT